MTAQEQQMLQGLIERVNKTQLTDKDPDAEGMLENSLGRNPDSIYILSQTVLVQGYALEQAQKQLADLRAQAEQLKQQAQAPVKHTSFLGSLLGRDEEPARAVAPPPPPPQQQAQYAPVPAYPAGASYPSGGGFGLGQPGGYGGAPQGGGFLRGAMQTAAGVAAGALAFEGVESLMHGFGHAAGYGSDFGGGFGGGPREEVINNYYGDSAQGGEHHGGSFLGDSGGETGDVPSQDNLRGFDDSPSGGAANFADSSDTSRDDSAGESFDQGSDQGDDGVDDSGSDFDSGSDDSGGFDSGDSGDQSDGDGF